jgi:hypothetical protein
MSSRCGTLFLREQAAKGIIYNFFNLTGGDFFSMQIDAHEYSTKHWSNYYEAVHEFIIELSPDELKLFWLEYRENRSFVNWNNVVKANVNSPLYNVLDDVTKICDFVTDFEKKVQAIDKN